MSRDRVTIAVRAAEPSQRDAIVERARRRGFARFETDDPQGLSPGPGEELIRRDGDRLHVPGGPADGVLVRRIRNEADLDGAMRPTPETGPRAIEWAGDRVIPLENAIASARRSFPIWVYARGPEEAPGSLGALEHGADRVFVEVRSPEDIDRLEALVEGPAESRLDWVLAPVRSVRPAGIADRVLVDTTSLLGPSEGILVGSSAAFLFFVASEAVGSEFSRPRPFRVNAGAAHSYVLMADGQTRYLSELEPGDSVLAAIPGERVRSVRVGRVKIERRPTVVVTAEVDTARRTVFLQEAETVRLVTADGPVATTALAPGESVRGIRLPAARHLGKAVDETIEER